MIKIQPSGDYVQLIYVDPVQQSVQQELRSDTDAFEVSYDSDGKLFMQFGAMRFENPDPTDFEVDGSPVTDAADFISKLNALFTGGGGGGATIYTGDGSLLGDRTIDLNGHSFSIQQDGSSRITVAIAGNNENVNFIAQNSIGTGNFGTASAFASETEPTMYIEASFQDETKFAKINLYANETEGEIEISADVISINGSDCASGTFTSQDGKTITVVNGLITSIV